MGIAPLLALLFAEFGSCHSWLGVKGKRYRDAGLGSRALPNPVTLQRAGLAPRCALKYGKLEESWSPEHAASLIGILQTGEPH